VVLTAAEYEYAERLNEKRLWKPPYGCRLAERRWVGQPVHVTWMPPVFERAGALYTDKGIESAWIIKWFGFVHELNRQVPGTELLPHKDIA